MSRLTRTIAFLAALTPAAVAARPAVPEDQPAPNADQSQRYESSMSQDSRLGVLVIGLTPELRAYFGAPKDSGLLVAQVVQGSAASRAGLRVGDVITLFAGQKVQSAVDIVDDITQLQGRQRVQIEVVRDHRPVALRATLGRAPQQPQPPQPPPEEQAPPPPQEQEQQEEQPQPPPPQQQQQRPSQGPATNPA